MLSYCGSDSSILMNVPMALFCVCMESFGVVVRAVSILKRCSCEKHLSCIRLVATRNCILDDYMRRLIEVRERPKEWPDAGKLEEFGLESFHTLLQNPCICSSAWHIRPIEWRARYRSIYSDNHVRSVNVLNIVAHHFWRMPWFQQDGHIRWDDGS